MLFVSKSNKINNNARNIYKSIWETGKSVCITRDSFYRNSIRVNFYACGRYYQIHVISVDLVTAYNLQYEKPVYDTDSRLLKFVAWVTANNEFSRKIGDVSRADSDFLTI